MLAILIWLGGLGCFVGSYQRCVEAQIGDGEWSEIVAISDEVESVDDADMATDIMGNVHVVWSSAAGWDIQKGEWIGGKQPPTSEYSLFYARKDASGWSQPVNIIASSSGALHPRILVDKAGKAHLFWRGNCLEYSMCAVDSALSPQAWAEPICLLDAPVHRFGVAMDREGAMYIAAPNIFGTQISLIKSFDGGTSWSAPLLVAERREDYFLSHPSIAIDEAGRIHIAWAENSPPAGYPPAGILYAYSADGGLTWSPVRRFAETNHGEPNIATFGADMVHIVWNGTIGLRGRYHVWSSDRGTTWSDIEEVVSKEHQAGLLLGPGLVFDGTGALHLVAGTDYGLAYRQWRDGQWSPLELVGKHESYSPGIAISNGNLLHAIWVGHLENLEIPEANRVYHASRPIAAPAIPAQAFAVATATPSPPTRTETPATAPTPTSLALAARPENSMDQSPEAWSRLIPFIAGFLPAIVLVLGVIGIRMLRLRRHR